MATLKISQLKHYMGISEKLVVISTKDKQNDMLWSSAKNSTAISEENW